MKCAHVSVREGGVQVAQYAPGISLAAACAQWCTQYSAVVVQSVSPAYGLAVVTVALPDQARRTVEFVLAVG